MKKSLAHLPLNKKQELKRLKSIILEKAPETEFIILFGSYARGNWVDDEYVENYITYSYRSDFDILVVTGDKKSPNKAEIWSEIEQEYYQGRQSRTPVDIIPHYINEVNTKLKEGHYFYSEIKREGIEIYNSGKYKLERKRKIDPARRLQIALDDFEQWFGSANEFFDDYTHNLKLKRYSKAAFELHQATERFYGTAMLVCAGDRPKIHNIERLGKMTARYYPEFIKIFPRKTEEEDRLFLLLKNAYVDARYNKDYCITQDELTYLSQRVEKLRNLVEKNCQAKIENLKKTK